MSTGRFVIFPRESTPMVFQIEEVYDGGAARVALVYNPGEDTSYASAYRVGRKFVYDLQRALGFFGDIDSARVAIDAGREAYATLTADVEAAEAAAIAARKYADDADRSRLRSQFSTIMQMGRPADVDLVDEIIQETCA